MVQGSGGRKERDDKNKAADLYLAINHSRIIFFFLVVFEDYAINELVHEFFILYHYSFEEVARLLWHFHSSGSLCLGGEAVNPQEICVLGRSTFVEDINVQYLKVTVQLIKTP